MVWHFVSTRATRLLLEQCLIGFFIFVAIASFCLLSVSLPFEGNIAEMHLVFISSLLTLTHTGLYPSSPAPWPSPTNYILKSNETYNPSGCSIDGVLTQINEFLSGFHRGIIRSIARKEPSSYFRLEGRTMDKVRENAWALWGSRIAQRLFQKEPKNFFISPLAISLAISTLTSPPVEKDTASPERTTRSGTECFQLMGVQPLIDYFNNYENTGLALASCVFVSPKVELRPEFIETVTKTFRAPLRSVNFDDAIERNDFINGWGANQVTSLVNENTSLALVNVIDFQGEWLHKFRVADTLTYRSVDDIQHKTENVYFMRMTAHLRNGRHPTVNASFYELPFKSGDDARNMSMFVITPDPIKIVDSLLSLVTDRFEEFTIKELMSSGTYSTIPIFLPKFTVESVVDMKPAVVEMLANDRMFNRETTKFRGITGSSDLFGDNLVQRISVQVDESGCLAVTSDTLPDPTPLKHTLWHTTPRYVLIGTTDANPQIIFSGRVYI